ncbi:MAG: TusE/DsrC/DsvC family sulfur relay protein [Candidatus Latescibacteria bacterium]|nr:TusE/DsrC/DsvC family sulfur relay protein [Candidatus Latescibacterota bacterium]NIO56729.1 TusE/DsrC/DsvC family sulfur relay protein [Candidatus Latescibacterota bacterium]NIT02314.1 TusE/DsrC/DsvC family sulfur relay protein [Candidatus Latescibacterota bacterium]NIT39197.1 TusE/DsrC/DsvC family sulfur relay protein [Candidatus Latescibacterota bacterium]
MDTDQSSADLLTAGKLTEEELDNDGFLQELSTWTRDKAVELAERNDLGPLTEEHWKVIEYVQEYFLKNGHGPPIVKIGKAVGMTSKQICTLFPCGVARGAYRLAGLPRPDGCL